MATQTGTQTGALRPLNVVRAPLAEARAGENLEFYGGRTLPVVEWSHVYLGRWPAADRKQLDRAIPAALSDARLNGVLAQYFPHEQIGSVFRGAQAKPLRGRELDKPSAEKIVRSLALDSLAVLLLPPGVVLRDGEETSEHGLAGYHGSVGAHYYAVAVYSEGGNGIVAFDEPWKNVCATVYHELEEARTDPDVEVAARTGDESKLGWYSPRGGEIGDIPIATYPLSQVMREVPLADGSGTVPVQLMWSNKDSAPAAS
jgi:hypothetical protein